MHRSIVHLTVCSVVGLAMTLLASATDPSQSAGGGPAGISQNSASGSDAQVQIRGVLQAHEPLINGIEAMSSSFAAASDAGQLDSTLLCRNPAGGLSADPGDGTGLAQPASASLAPQVPARAVGMSSSNDQVLGVRLPYGDNPDIAFDDQVVPPVAVPPPLSVWGGLALMAALALVGIRRRMRFASPGLGL